VPEVEPLTFGKPDEKAPLTGKIEDVPERSSRHSPREAGQPPLRKAKRKGFGALAGRRCLTNHELLLASEFQFPRQIFFSLLPQELGRALAEFRVIGQPIERIPPQKIRANRVFLEAAECKMD
jgi:hypothetical protein